jgi:alpha-galactosidase
MIDNRIKDYGVSIYRQDYNFPPLRYWRENEDYDRRGMNENLYVQGYLRFWDTLLERNPGLLIDSCASGGRRNDLETMRRSVPLHPTDYGYGYHPIQQAFARTLSTWIPYYRICGGRWENEDGSYIPYQNEDHTYTKRVGKPADYYSRISYIAPFFPFGLGEVDDDEMAFIRTWMQAAPLMISGDYYPLSEAEKSEDHWFVNEFYSPEQGLGFLQAVRNRTCKQESFCAHLKGLEPQAAYQLDNYRTGERWQRLGRDLMEKGFTLRHDARDASAWIITKIED